MLRRISAMIGLLLSWACGPQAGQDTAASLPAGTGDSTRTTAALPAQSAQAEDRPGSAAAVARDSTGDIGPRTELPPNELGRVPILEYHLVGRENARWTVTPEKLRSDLELLWRRGYRPVSLRELVDRSFSLPAGTSPVVITFDDASPGQFRYLERDGELTIDPNSAVAVLLEFARTHPGWRNRAVFCVLSGAEAGRSFFGNRDIEGQKTEWRHRKIAFLVEQGFEVCNHTLWHATLSKYSDTEVQEQIARLQLAVDSASPGYRISSFALPLGVWPKNRELARHGAWTDPRSGKRIEYRHQAILLVAGEPARSPYDPQFDPLKLPRVQVYANQLERTLDRLDQLAARYVSDGDPDRVTKGGGST